MSSYREWRAEDDLGPAVACLWSRTTSGGTGTVLPDGCTDILWHSGELVVAGPDTAPNPTDLPAGIEIAAIRFRPGVAPAVLGVPASELRNVRVPLADVWGADATDRLVERLGERPPAAALQEAVRDRLRSGPGIDPLARAVVGGLGRRRPWPVARLAAELGVSERQLHRRCVPAFGYGAKTLDRVLRLQRLLRLARDGRSGGLAELAVTAGYADQAHLGHEVRALAGTTPAKLIG